MTSQIQELQEKEILRIHDFLDMDQEKAKQILKQTNKDSIFLIVFYYHY